ncbi:MAG: undecaprenyl-phosphate galactose phosphotransferase WbaP [Spirochaetales bacterium]|nr:undecaprenyl-phosphate galactose phosphotransferase WbaP [Spirochaetales bacterium]
MHIDEYCSWFRKRYRSTSSFGTATAFIVSDVITIMLCIGAGFFIVNAVDKHFINFKSFVTYWTYLPFFCLVYYIFKLYPGILLVPSEQLRSLFLANAFMFGGISISILVETDGREYLAAAFIVAFFFSTFSLPLSRSIARKWVFSRFTWWGIPAVIYGEGQEARDILDNLLDNPSLGYIPVALVNIVEIDLDEYRGIPVIHSIEDSKRLNLDLHIKMAIILSGEHQSEVYRHLLITTLSNFRYNIIIPRLNFYNTLSMTIRDINGTLGLATTHHLTKGYNMAVKRLMDLLLLFTGTLLLLPFLFLVALLIKISSRGPILYGHTRIGRNGKEIKVWKFRSMVPDAAERLSKLLQENPDLREEWDRSHKLSRDPRVTGIGRFLRKTSLDELPQLINVLKGEMSFIGPRPVTHEEIEKYGEKFNYIFSVSPGLSGMWQVSGRSDTDYAERVAFDSYYIQNWSLWLDIWLIFRTIGVVLSGKGAR